MGKSKRKSPNKKQIKKFRKKSVSKRPKKSLSKRPKKSRRYHKKTSSSVLNKNDEKCVFTYTDDTDTEYIIFTHENKKHRLKNMPNIKSANLELITDEEARLYLMNGKNKNISKGKSKDIKNVNKKLKSVQDYNNSQEVRMSSENEPVSSIANMFARRKQQRERKKGKSLKNSN